MNYLEIVLQGYFNENNREFLEKYFFREFKKAEKEQFFEADEFFNGCINVIEGWEKYLQDKVIERKRELYLMLDGAKNSTMKYGDLQGKTIEQKRQETIEYCEQELKDVRPNGIGSLSFTVHLHSLTNGRIAYNMAYNEVLQIKRSILKAFQKTQPQKKALPPQPIRTKADIFKENLQQGGFYNLEKVQRLTQEGQNELVELICENMAYGIAMFDYLDFCEFLDKEKGTKEKANFYLSRLYNKKVKDGTRSRHLRNSLINNKPRHTSYLHIEKTIKDYEKLK